MFLSVRDNSEKHPLNSQECPNGVFSCTQVLISGSAFGIGRTQAVTHMQVDVNKDLVMVVAVVHDFVKMPS